jgi:putative heme-binding domain-containing protein
LTDVEFGKDGAMYLTIGGRGTQAALYRVRWTGGPVTDSSNDREYTSKAIPPLNARRLLESSGGEMRREGRVNALGSSDPFISFAGKVGLERSLKSVGKNRDNPLAWSHPASAGSFYEGTDGRDRAELNALLLAIRTGTVEQGAILERLKRYPLAGLSDAKMLLKLRVLELTFARQGRPSDEWVKTGLEKLISRYPAKGTEAAKLNRELCQLLVWLSNPALGDEASPGDNDKRDPLGPAPNPGANVHADRKGAAFHAELGQQIIERTLALMDAAPSQEEQIYYALCLRWAHGWTPPQRERYFRWFHEKAVRFTGGNSFAKFVDRIRADAVSRIPETEKGALSAWLGAMASAEPQKSKPQEVKPRPFVKAWTLTDLEPALDALKSRQPDLAKGKQLYAEAQCAQCHLFGNGGGNVGPDLTAVAQRFGRKDILEAILDPNKAVSDQYAMITLTVRKFGGGGEEQVSGLVQEETSATITLLTDPLSGRTANYYTNVITKREKANVSIMPPALLNTLSAEEVADLLAYLGAK